MLTPDFWLLAPDHRLLNPDCGEVGPFPILEPLHFRTSQVAHPAGVQALIRKEGNPHALQLYHSLANALKHAPHLMVAAFHQGNFKPGLVIPSEGANLAGLRPSAIKRDAGLEFGNTIGVRPAFQLHLVSPGNRRRSRHQEIGQLAIIGQDQQSGGVIVQSPHRIDALLDSLHQRHHGGAALWVFYRGNVTDRLVDE